MNEEVSESITEFEANSVRQPVQMVIEEEYNTEEKPKESNQNSSVNYYTPKFPARKSKTSGCFINNQNLNQNAPNSIDTPTSGARNLHKKYMRFMSVENMTSELIIKREVLKKKFQSLSSGKRSSSFLKRKADFSDFSVTHRRSTLIGGLKKFTESNEQSERKKILNKGSYNRMHAAIIAKEQEANLLNTFCKIDKSGVQKLEEKVKTKNDITEKLYKTIQTMEKSELYDQAAFYFRHAISTKAVRSSFPNTNIRWLYVLQMKPIYYMVLVIISWLYLFLAFIEPISSADFSLKVYSTKFLLILIFEIIALIIMLLDLVFDIIIKSYDKNESKLTITGLIKNKKLWVKFLTRLGLLLDMILFYSLYPNKIEYFRFGRVLRVISIFLQHKYARRTILSIMKTWKFILDLLLLMFFIILIFSLVAVKMVKQDMQAIENDPTLNNENDLTSWGKATVTIYFLLSLTNYPTVIYPYMSYNYNYFFLFLPMVLFIVFMLIPIPVAILFREFKRNRGKVLLQDKLKEKHALFWTHCFLDSEKKGYLVHQQWKRFVGTLFKHKKENERKDFEDIFLDFDVNGDEKMDIKEFFHAGELVLCLKGLENFVTPTVPGWDYIQNFFNKTLRLFDILSSRYFDMLRFSLIIATIVLTILAAVSFDEERIELYTTIDMCILYAFTVEIGLTIIAVGPGEYFNDPLSLVDSFCVIISYFLNAPITLLRILKYPKTANSLIATSNMEGNKKINKQEPKGLCRRFNIFIILSHSLLRIKTMLSKVILSFSAVKQLLLLGWLTFYIYAIFSVEWFYKLENSGKENPFQGLFFGSFRTFTLALMTLLQILTQSSWHQMVLNYAEKGDNNYYCVVLYFALFHFLIVIIIINLIIGLVWEVLTMMDNDNPEMEELDTLNEEFVLPDSQIKPFNSNQNIDLELEKCSSDSNSISQSEVVKDYSFRHQKTHSERQLIKARSKTRISPTNVVRSEQSMDKIRLKDIYNNKMDSKRGSLNLAVNAQYFFNKGLIGAIGNKKARKLETKLIENLTPLYQTMNFQVKNKIEEEVQKSKFEKKEKDLKEIRKYFKRFLNGRSLKLLRHLRNSFFTRNCITEINLISQKIHYVLPNGVLFFIGHIVEEKMNSEVTESNLYFPYYEDQQTGIPNYVKIPNIINNFPNIEERTNFRFDDYFREINELGTGENSILTKKEATYKSLAEISNILKGHLSYLTKRLYSFNIRGEIINHIKTPKVPEILFPFPCIEEHNNETLEIPNNTSLETIRNMYVPNELPNNTGSNIRILQTVIFWCIPKAREEENKWELEVNMGENLQGIEGDILHEFTLDVKDAILRYKDKYLNFICDFYDICHREGDETNNIYIPGEKMNDVALDLVLSFNTNTLE